LGNAAAECTQRHGQRYEDGRENLVGHGFEPASAFGAAMLILIFFVAPYRHGSYPMILGAMNPSAGQRPCLSMICQACHWRRAQPTRGMLFVLAVPLSLPNDVGALQNSQRLNIAALAQKQGISFIKQYSSEISFIIHTDFTEHAHYSMLEQTGGT